MEQKGQKAELDVKLSLRELVKTWMRSVTAKAAALFEEAYPDFAGQVTQSIASGSRFVARKAVSRLPSDRSQRLNSRQRVDLATRIFVEHGSAIRLMIRQHAVANQEEEDEAYQNLYLSLVCNPPPQPLANVRAYLNTVIRNDIIEAMRRRKKRQAMITRYAMSRARQELDNSPDDFVAQAEEARRIVNLLAVRLPTREARAVIERYMYGYSATEVAQHLQVKRETASQYACNGLRRARAVASRD
jgi:RNA polymerase sigma factor (sigma-70 family)